MSLKILIVEDSEPVRQMIEIGDLVDESVECDDGAKLVMPGKDPGGIFITILIGIAGALVAGFLGRGLGWYAQGEPVGFVAALLGLYRFLRREA